MTYTQREAAKQIAFSLGCGAGFIIVASLCRKAVGAVFDR